MSSTNSEARTPRCRDRGPRLALTLTALAALVAPATGCLVGAHGWPDEGDAATAGESASDGDEPRYTATIRWTADGVPHVLADDFASAGYGLGYAFAKDHTCTLADQVIKVRGERARFLGPGTLDKHINSDFGHLALDILGRADAALAGLDASTRDAVDGYVAGYNRHLAEVGPDGIGGWCEGAEWLRPITARELVAYHLTLGMVASSSQVIEFIATAAPPGSADAAPGRPISELGAARQSGLGSNGWALGKEKSASGRGMVLGNPHFPWLGELRLWESHVTIPDQVNVYGAALLGVPAINIGFNENVGWTHTFSQLGQRLTIYAVDLVPGEPTRYYYGDEIRDFTTKEYTIAVKQDDGALVDNTRTLYSSHYGPIINVLGFGWNEMQAATYRDANLTNDKLIPLVLEMNRAADLEAFKRAFSETKGMPWAHTMAADKHGATWYIDASATPNLRPETVQGWLDSLEVAGIPRLVFEEVGVMLISGSDPLNEWVEEPGARDPGLIPHDRLPALDRDDYVFNANDSHWLSNLAAPLVGYPATHGRERVPQSLRTRSNLQALTAVGEGTYAGADGKYSLEELQAAVFGNTSVAVDLLLSDVVARCQGVEAVDLEGEKIFIDEACALLAGWNGRVDLDSVGALVWREFMGSYSGAARLDRGLLFGVAFDPDDPLATPHTLNPAPPPEEGEDNALKHLAMAVRSLGEAGVALDATLRDTQYADFGGVRYPIHGGAHAEGVLNQVFHSVLQTSSEPHPSRGEVINATTDLTDEGYALNYGSSFVMAMEYTDEGPRARTILTYGQSEDPESPGFGATFDAFANKQWRDVRFTEADIASDPGLVTVELSGD